MTREIITAALEAEGFKAGAQAVTVPEDREATFYIGTHGETLNVPCVVKVETRERYIVLQTIKDERFVFSYEDVLGMRVLTAAQAKERAAGFAR